MVCAKNKHEYVESRQSDTTYLILFCQRCGDLHEYFLDKPMVEEADAVDQARNQKHIEQHETILDQIMASEYGSDC